MTAPTPVDRVGEVLTGAGYRSISTPLEIAGLRFDLPAAFVGSSPSPDLIVVADTAFDPEQRILKKIEGIARAMDVVRSKRPLTAVLTGPRPSSAVLDSMSRVCRVLPIGTILDADADTALRNWLAVLMPLSLPEPTASIADPLTEIAGQLGGLDPEIASLVSLAPEGADVVQSHLHTLISDSLNQEDGGGEP
ncbi:hypothetical protein [Rhizobium sp. AB2/73]|uniref:hypothetical protein n=1 Tax=Rhizobium TaxID=379 RepID=UPI000DDC6863|nr:hypothetical protein [Rhizobium sp. AB2/73]QYA15924.1 hypothetical protein J5284_28435 [Rhizobium sp. AB2/73]UEQ84467.1 hypothetical protein I8E17_29765 [Rhizobium sp. AB2/73]